MLNSTRYALIVAVVSASLSRAEVVYQSDFAEPGGPEWTLTSTAVTPSGEHYLGRFGAEPVMLSLEGLPEHSIARLSFDLYIMHSWDGNQVFEPGSGAQVGPDIWALSVVGGPTLLTTTFSNIDQGPPFDYPQAFPDAFPGGSHPPRSGAADVGALGFGLPTRDTTYRLSFEIPHDTSTLAFEFRSSAFSLSLDDESWGLDNVLVETWPDLIPGDANGDGLVSGADYTIWADNFDDGTGPGGKTWQQGDWTGEGYVTGADYTIWADHYGVSVDAMAVPEPSCVMLALASTVCCTCLSKCVRPRSP